MEGTWDVFCNGERAGTCTVEAQGLYSRFRCRCVLPDGQIRCLVMRIGTFEQNLGVLAPAEGETFSVETRLASARIPAGEPAFGVRLRREKLAGQYTPVCPEEPYAYLARLGEAYLVRRDGKPGLMLPREGNQ